MNFPVKIFARSKRLIVELPLTSPRGKVRVKRRVCDYGLPVATRRQCFTKDDYVEWQVSYATQDPPQESKVEEIIIHRNQTGFELTKLLWEGLKLGIFSDKDINELIKFTENVQPTETLEENEKILRENDSQEIKGGFKKIVEKVPIFIKENKEIGYFVEIILKHREKGIGLQAMVYLCVYVEKLRDRNGESLVGRITKTKEFGQLEITTANKMIITDTVKAFALASQQHRNDILNVLRQIKEKCKL